ncbi:STM3941 family protein [Tabrizicola sp.]|uniref:STM3941 family protein n=1 Tax=Tabrizicola sp. TaxID=2005166 RepID=UPI003F2D6F33
MNIPPHKDIAASAPDQIVEIQGSPTKLIGVLIGSILFALIYARLAFGYVSIPANKEYAIYGYGFGVLFFGAIIAITIKRLLSAPKAIITLSPAGYHDTRVSERPIPWEAIREILIWKMHSQRVIVLKVPPEVEASIGLTPIARWTRGGNAKFGADGLSTVANGLNISHDDLLAAIASRATAATAIRKSA